MCVLNVRVAAKLRRGPLYHLAGHVGRLVALGVLFQEVGEEEYLQDGENDKQFDYNDSPQRLAQTHVAKAVIVEMEGSLEYSLFIHRHGMMRQRYVFFLKLPSFIILNYVKIFG